MTLLNTLVYLAIVIIVIIVIVWALKFLFNILFIAGTSYTEENMGGLHYKENDINNVISSQLLLNIK